MRKIFPKFIKHRYLHSFLLGALATLALPPFFILPGLIIGISGLYYFSANSKSAKQAFFTGWFFGFGHFVTGIYWIVYALLTDPEKFAWMVPFAISGLPAVLAIYIGIVSLLIYFLPVRSILRILLFSSIWVIIEILRSILFSGFPWNLIGYSLNFSTALIQVNSVTGIYGASFLVAIFSTMPALFINKTERRSKANIIALAISILIIPALFIFGTWRLSSNKAEGNKEITAAIVQANISQHQKWEPSLRMKGFMEHVTQTEELQKQMAAFNLAGTRLIIWPESGVPYFLAENKNLQGLIQKTMQPNDILVTGALRQEGDSRENYKIWNSIFFLNKAKGVIAHYDKVHLVPFGEFIPLRNILWFVDKITHGAVDFSSGLGAATLDVAGAKISPSVCYEAIFSGKMINKDERPELMVNVTNDAWFGVSTGPYQHFEMARVRAVEEGIPLIRAANTGISGVFDAYGRIIGRTALNEKTNLIVPLQLKTTNTIFSTYGIFLPIIFIAAIIPLTLLGLKRRG